MAVPEGLIQTFALPAPAVSGNPTSNLLLLAGGLGMFLFGMTLTSNALKALAGRTVQRIVALFTSNRFMGLGLGAGLTVLLNSSSAATVLCVTLGSAGLLALRNAGSLLLGAGIGTALTVQVMAFNVGEAALIAVFIGAAIRLTAASGKWKDTGEILLGIGLIFYGMAVMKNGSGFLRQNEAVLSFLGTLNSHPFLAMLVSVAFTAIIQSSAGTIVIVFELVLGQGAPLGMTAGVAMVLGANIGTAATGMLASIGRPRAGRQVAVEMLLFRVIGVIVAFPMLPLLVKAAQSSAVLLGSPEISRRAIANSHLIFNIFLAAFFLPLLGPMTRLLEKIVSGKSSEADRLVIHIHPDLKADCSKATAAAVEEIQEMLGRMRAMLESLSSAVKSGKKERLSALHANIAVLADYRIIILRYIRALAAVYGSNTGILECLRACVEVTERTGTILQLLGDLVLPGLEALHGGRTDVSIEAGLDLGRLADNAIASLGNDPGRRPKAEHLEVLGGKVRQRRAERLLRGLEEALGGEKEFSGVVEGLLSISRRAGELADAVAGLRPPESDDICK